MTLGFIGTGAITAAMVTGLSSPRGPRCLIRLSPRNPQIAAGLSSSFDNVTVCASNQAVLDSCPAIVLAIRPQVAREVLSALTFSPEHLVITVIAGFSVQRVAELIRPAARIWRAVPLPAVAERSTPIPIYPGAGAGADLLAPLGPILPAASEDHLSAFGTATSTMAAYFGFIQKIFHWLSNHGIPEDQARQYVAHVFSGLAAAAIDRPNSTFEQLAQAHATPGGLNEQVLAELRSNGAFTTLRQALDSVHLRSTAHPA